MDAAGDRGVADVHERVINHIFGSGLILTGLATHPGVDRDVEQRLLEVIERLDAAVHELRIAALDRVLLWADESDGALLTPRPGTPFARRLGGMFYAIDSQIPLCYEAVRAHAAPARPSDLSVATIVGPDIP